MDVFDAFPEGIKPYEFLTIKRGGVYGNQITDRYGAEGIYKRRDDMVQVNNQELRQSAATIKIRPTEPFIADITVDGEIKFVGNGIRFEGADYEIIGDTAGDNYEDGVREHYQLTLQVADFSDLDEVS